VLNRAAAFYEAGRYDEAIADCQKAIELARSQRADFKLLARYACFLSLHDKRLC
jgi:tetratricopeptide (TPR) repeat protein